MKVALLPDCSSEFIIALPQGRFPLSALEWCSSWQRRREPFYTLESVYRSLVPHPLLFLPLSRLLLPFPPFPPPPSLPLLLSVSLSLSLSLSPPLSLSLSPLFLS